MRRDVKSDWAWSDGYLPDVRRILLMNAFELFDLHLATAQQDLTQATDMVITTGGEKKIAVRIRREDCKYRDLTIRAWRKGGTKTELEKIKAGAGDFYLYGWAKELSVAEWILVDMELLRKSKLLEGRKIIPNPDKRSGFIAIPVYELRESDCMIAEQMSDQNEA